MAVLEALKGLHVHIITPDGSHLSEYTDNNISQAEDGPPQVSKYIEAITDQQFGIRILMTDAFEFNCPTMGFQILLDGCAVRQPIVRREMFEKNKKTSKIIVYGLRVLDRSLARCVLQKFKFSKIDTVTEDKLEEVHNDTQTMSRVGEIMVKVYRRSEAVDRGPKLVLGKVLEDRPEVVHESALKGEAKSHGISLSSGKADKFATHWESDYLDGEDKPLGILKFKYRNRDALRSLLIIRDEPEMPELKTKLQASPRIFLAAAVPSRTASRAATNGAINMKQEHDGMAAPSKGAVVDLQGLTPEQISFLVEQANRLRQGGMNTPPVSPVPRIKTKKADRDPTKHSVKRDSNNDEEEGRAERENDNGRAAAEARKRRKIELMDFIVIDDN